MTSKIIIGVDEVARGCLVGPVVACALVLKHEILSTWITSKNRPKITDSKRMTHGERVVAKDWLQTTGALATGIGEASVDEIAELNIRNATFLAMNRAISTCLHNLNLADDQQKIKCIIDGNAFRIMPGFETVLARLDPITEIKADLNNPTVACASILAKEYRDHSLDRLATENPEDFGNYGWATNRGYGTKDHYAAILREGLCVHHRLGFLGSVLHRTKQETDS